jgi:N-acetylglucosaminyldiphosphoundecaprenol N-acetyl-beta-D-mannosaminyltransferase
MINEERVDIVVLGLGTPLQERTALDLARRTTGRFFVTCGGFISQTAARGDYYHSWVKALGLRALQRIILEPHVRKRVIKDYPIFVARYLSARLSEKWSARRMGKSKP